MYAVQSRRAGERPREKTARLPPPRVEPNDARTAGDASVEHVCKPAHARHGEVVPDLGCRAVRRQRSGWIAAVALSLRPTRRPQPRDPYRPMARAPVSLTLNRQPGFLVREQCRAAVQIDDAAPGRPPARKRAGRQEVDGGGHGIRRGRVAPLPARSGSRAGPRLEEAVPADRAVVDQRDDVRVPERRQRGAASEPGVGLDAASDRHVPQPDGLARRQVDRLTRGRDEEPVGEDKPAA